MKIAEITLAAVLVTGFAAVGRADLSTDLNTQASQMNSLATSQGTSKVVDKISGEFSDFLGADSKAVVTGLRNGTPITLTRTVSTPTGTTGTVPANTTSPLTTTTTTITNPPPVSTPTGTTGTAPANTTPPITTTTTIINPPTGKMGFGNVFISLALAKQELAQLGITQPTPEQLKAALVGGRITTGTGTTTTGTASGGGATTNTTRLHGILTMRSHHMGWGQIAHRLGFKLGPVISSIKTANHHFAAGTLSTKTHGIVTAANQTNAGAKGAIISGSGRVHGDSAQEHSGLSNSDKGIVTASGRSINNGNAYGKGIVTGSGHIGGLSSSGTTNGGPGNSSGHGNGHNK